MTLADPRHRARAVLAKIKDFSGRLRLKGEAVPALSVPAARVLKAAAAGQKCDPEQLKRSLAAADKLESQLVWTYLRVTTPVRG